MRRFVKVCGLTSSDAVAAAVAAGADALGFVFADSPREIDPQTARELTVDLPPGILRVAVMRHPEPSRWAEIAEIFQPDCLQTEAEDFATLEIGAGVMRLPVFRDTPALDLTAAAQVDLLLFEAAASGTGQRADWDRAAGLAAQTRLILAGGLDPDNVGDALRQVRPHGVDVSSGVERRRGVKDPQRIAAFVDAVRRAERLDAN